MKVLSIFIDPDKPGAVFPVDVPGDKPSKSKTVLDAVSKPHADRLPGAKKLNVALVSPNKDADTQTVEGLANSGGVYFVYTHEDDEKTILLQYQGIIAGMKADLTALALVKDEQEGILRALNKKIMERLKNTGKNDSVLLSNVASKADHAHLCQIVEMLEKAVNKLEIFVVELKQSNNELKQSNNELIQSNNELKQRFNALSYRRLLDLFRRDFLKKFGMADTTTLQWDEFVNRISEDQLKSMQISVKDLKYTLYKGRKQGKLTVQEEGNAAAHDYLMEDIAYAVLDLTGQKRTTFGKLFTFVFDAEVDEVHWPFDDDDEDEDEESKV